MAAYQNIFTQIEVHAGEPYAGVPIEPGPFVVQIALDDADLARRLPAGATGQAAIFTEHIQFDHVVRKVVLRQIAILNYINPF